MIHTLLLVTLAAGTIPLPGVEGRMDHMAIDSQRHRLYIAALENSSLEVIDLVAQKRIKSIPKLGKPAGVRAVPGSGEIVLACGGDGKVRFFDADLNLTATIDHLDDADNVRLDAEAKHAYVGYGEGAIAIIDLATHKKIGDIQLAGHPESFQLEAHGPRIFVNVPSAGHVAVLDRAKGTTIARWPIKQAKANFPMALDEANQRLLIACRKPAKLLSLSTDDGRLIVSQDCCGDADDLFIDAASKCVYVTGGEGCISVFTDLNAAAEAITTAPGARTSILDPEEKKLYVAVPHRGEQAAEIRIYGLKRE